MTKGTKFFKKSKDYKSLYKTLVDRYDKDTANRLFCLAGQELDLLLDRYSNCPKGERHHTDKYIFPRIALYRVLKEYVKEEAISWIEEAVREEGEKTGKLLKRLTAIPFMEKLFIKIIVSLAKNMFGEKNGFRQIFYTTSKDTVKFDILECIYCRYCKLCNCPELIHTFCDTDAYCFGNLSKIAFERKETLENDKQCDFTLTIVHNEKTRG